MSAAQKDHVPELDGLRAVAIALVIFAHVCAIALQLKGLWAHTNALGGLGVNVFFVLSGYLITTLLVREQERTGTIDFKKFYARRSLRIIPALGAYVAVVAVLKATGYVTDVRWIDFAICLFYLRNVVGEGPTFHHTWSLSLEEQFYLLWPPALRFLGRKRALPVALVLVVLINGWRIWSRFYLPSVDGPTLYFRPDYRFDSILCGCALALAMPHVGDATRARLGAISPLALVPIAIGWTIWQNVAQTASGTILLPVQTLLCTLIVASALVVRPGITRAVLASSPMTFVGRLSYSIYIWQQLFLVTRYPDWGVRQFPRDLACTLLAALGSYYLIEQPFLRLKKRFATA